MGELAVARELQIPLVAVVFVDGAPLRAAPS